MLGLRAIYFLLHDLMDRFAYLHYGLGLVLTFIGAKMLVAHWIEIPVQWSLGVVGALLAGSVLASWLFAPKRGGTEALLEEEPDLAASEEAAVNGATSPPGRD